MQLDTHVRNLLNMFANSGQPKIWELPPARARDMATVRIRQERAPAALPAFPARVKADPR
jgi:hypothetical protein